jgi:sugar phosphate permease
MKLSRRMMPRRFIGIVAVTFVALIGAAAFRSTTSIFFEPLETEFGWSRTDTSLALSVNLVFYGLVAPFSATLMERFSIRSVATMALVLVSLGTGLTVFMTSSWQLIALWGVLVGSGTGCLALVFGSMVASRWFIRHRGVVTGIFSAAYATGSLVFLPLISIVLIASGWKTASVIVACFSLLIAAVFFIFFRDRPEKVGLRPLGWVPTDEVPDAAPISVMGNLRVLRDASKTRAFWALALTFFICGWTTNGLIGAHFIPATSDHGMPLQLAAGLLAMVGVFDLVGTIASGWLTDRYNPVVLLAFYYGLRGLALFTVPFVLGPTAEPPLIFFVVFYGLDWIATVPPTIELCRRYFGVNRSGVVFGWVFASHMVGAAVASIFAGVIRQTQGTYFIAWITAAVLCLIATIYILSLLKESTTTKG